MMKFVSRRSFFAIASVIVLILLDNGMLTVQITSSKDQFPANYTADSYTATSNTCKDYGINASVPAPPPPPASAAGVNYSAFCGSYGNYNNCNNSCFISCTTYYNATFGPCNSTGSCFCIYPYKL